MIHFLNITFISFIFLCFSCGTAQMGEQEKDKTIVGEVTWDYWKANAGWALYEAYDYEPKQEEIIQLKKLLEGKNYKFVIFATTFCDECQENLPKLFELFEISQIPDSRIRLIGLDEIGTEPSGEYKKYDLGTTPEVFVLVDSVIIGQAGYPYQWLKNFIEIFENYGN